jgi:cytochrome c-type biogenesis protein CcmH
MSAARPTRGHGPSQGSAAAASADKAAGADALGTRFALLLLVAAIALSPILLLAADAVPTDKDPVASARAVALADKLRCLVCQNQTILESNAELAQDLRSQIREQIAAGKSDKEIVDYMVARYGDFVLYQPPVKSTTFLLWGGPALLVAIGFLVLARTVRLRRAQPDAPALTTDERERVARLLRGERAKDAS